MPEQRVRDLFDEIARLEVTVPAVQAVLARGRQRRSRTVLAGSASCLAVLAATGLGISQLTGAARGHLFDGAAGVPVAGTLHRSLKVPGPDGVNGAAQSGGGARANVLPPAGRQPLVLGLTASYRFAMTRVGSAAPPVPVPGLTSVADAPPILVTNPAGGWLVSYAAAPRTPQGSGPSRLALLSVTGRREPFGPVFAHQIVTSAAISPGHSQVALTLYRPSGGPASIEVLPMPGHRDGVRIWHIPLAEANFAASISWQPDGRHVSYIAGQQTGGGVAGGPETLDTAAPGSTAPGLSAWPADGTSGTNCEPDAAAWLGNSGQFAALEECPGGSGSEAREVLQVADFNTGAALRKPVVLAAPAGCGPAALDAAKTGERVLVSYCGSFIYLDDLGRLARVSGKFTAAALAG
jgi:hypothetical protein